MTTLVDDSGCILWAKADSLSLIEVSSSLELFSVFIDPRALLKITRVSVLYEAYLAAQLLQEKPG